MKILVIGASGFLGRRVFMELQSRGHLVSGPSLRGNAFGRLDIADRESCSDLLERGRFDSVVNLAGRGVTPGSASESEMQRVNHMGVASLVEAIVASKEPPWLVHASSSTEQCEKDTPESGYTSSKVAGTLALRLILRDARIPFALARIHNTYGPSQPRGRFVMGAIMSLRARESVYVRYPARVRDFCYIAEVVRHLVAMAEGPRSRTIVSEIGTGKGTSLWDLVDIVRHRVGAPAGLMMRPEICAEDLNRNQVADSKDPFFLRCDTLPDMGIDMTLGSLP